MLIYFILSCFLQGPPMLLLDVVSLIFSLGLGACIAYNCGSWLGLVRMEGLYFTGITFCPEMPKLTPGRARKASLLRLSICLSFPGLLQWFLTLSLKDKCLISY